MTSPDGNGVAQVLEQIAAFLELQGENPFRVRAFALSPFGTGLAATL